MVDTRLQVRWHADGAEVDQKVLALSTYMGHADFFYTYCYLTAQPAINLVQKIQLPVGCLCPVVPVP